jgi:hypothetical protein
MGRRTGAPHRYALFTCTLGMSTGKDRDDGKCERGEREIEEERGRDGGQDYCRNQQHRVRPALEVLR